MKKKNLVLTVLFIALFMGNNYQMSAQVIESKSNEILEIISIDIPNSVHFKPAKGVEIKSVELSVYLVSETANIRAEEFKLKEGSQTSIGLDKGKLTYYYSDKSELYAMKFNVTANTVIQKIKFVVDEREMYFDIAKYEWDSDSTFFQIHH